MIEVSLFVAVLIMSHLFPPDEVQDRVILLPEDDGSVGALVVTGEGGSQVVDEAYAGATVRRSGAIEPSRESAEAVNARYGELLSGQPMPPASYLLYFMPGSDELVPASQTMLETVKQDAAARSAAEIRVIGHTDTTGRDAMNDELSRERAEFVIRALQDYGIEPLSFEATGRGERDLLVPTADGVAEPRNRRVEVSIR